MFKKSVIILLSSLLFLNSLIMPFAVAKAADEAPSTWYDQGFNDWYSKVYDDQNPSEIFGERYTAAQVQWIVYSLISLPLNFDQDTKKIVACFFSTMSGTIEVATCGEALLEKMDKFKEFRESNLTSSSIDFQQPSFLGSVFNHKRQMSGIGYISNFAGKYHLIPEAKAQGFGYSALNPIQKYWSGARDIAYALTVLVVIVFAFMIMFRVKLSPQLVISVQSALPKVFTALILATFSYAIAGFMIDLMYVFGGLFAILIKTGNFSTQDMTAIYKDIFPPNVTGLYFFWHMLWYDVFFLISVIVNMIAVMAAATVGSGLPGAAFSIVTILLVIWILILTIWYTFKATWVLVKTLISVYVNIITAPIQFVLGAVVPSMSFGNWFKKIMADLLVFPVTGLFMFFAWRLMWMSYSFGFKSIISEGIWGRVVEFFMNVAGADTSWFDTIWVPEILGFGQTTSGFLILLMSFGVIVAVPKVPDILKMLILGAKFDYGMAIGEAMAPVKMAGGLYVNPRMEEYEVAAKKAQKTTWEVARDKGEGAKFISLSALQRFLSGR